jgi:hypothetical protein
MLALVERREELVAVHRLPRGVLLAVLEVDARDLRPIGERCQPARAAVATSSPVTTLARCRRDPPIGLMVTM